MNENDVNKNSPDSGSKGVIVGVLVLVFLLVVIVAVAVFCLDQGAPEETPDPGPSSGGGIQWDADAEEGGLTVKSQEEIQKELNEKVAQGMINISMNTSPVFKDGTSEGNLLIVNSAKNNYPQVVYIVRKDTKEEIYRSGGIPVGSKVEKAKLAVDLDAGTYECVAYFNNVDMETGDFLGTAGAEIVVTVES